MKRAIIFDFDGVIIDSERHWRQVSHEFLQALIPTWGEDEQKQIFGLSARAVFERLTTVYGVALSWEQYLASYEGLAKEIYGKLAEPTPGALEFISFLSHSRYELGIVTSAPRIWLELVLDRFHLKERISTVVVAEDVGRDTKPSPVPYLLASKRMGREPSECVVFEDSPKGIQSAKEAGMSCIALGLPHTERHDLSGADAVILSFESIPVRQFDTWLSQTLGLPIKGLSR